jgi:hypothetical protein
MKLVISHEYSRAISKISIKWLKGSFKSKLSYCPPENWLLFPENGLSPSRRKILVTLKRVCLYSTWAQGNRTDLTAENQTQKVCAGYLK